MYTTLTFFRKVQYTCPPPPTLLSLLVRLAPFCPSESKERKIKLEKKLAKGVVVEGLRQIGFEYFFQTKVKPKRGLPNALFLTYKKI